MDKVWGVYGEWMNVVWKCITSKIPVNGKPGPDDLLPSFFRGMTGSLFSRFYLLWLFDRALHHFIIF